MREQLDLFSSSPDFPEGYDKQNPPPSGFVNEPGVYEEAHVQGQESEELTLIVDPNQLEIVAVIDLPVEEEDED